MRVRKSFPFKQKGDRKTVSRQLRLLLRSHRAAGSSRKAERVTLRVIVLPPPSPLFHVCHPAFYRPSLYEGLAEGALSGALRGALSTPPLLE